MHWVCSFEPKQQELSSRQCPGPVAHQDSRLQSRGKHQKDAIVPQDPIEIALPSHPEHSTENQFQQLKKTSAATTWLAKGARGWSAGPGHPRGVAGACSAEGCAVLYLSAGQRRWLMGFFTGIGRRISHAQIAEVV